MKKHIRQYLYYTIITAAGILMRIYTSHYYAAGLVTGIGAAILLLLFVGRKAAEAAGKRIDKQIRDNQLNR